MIGKSCISFVLFTILFSQNKCSRIHNRFHKNSYTVSTPDTQLTTPQLIRKNGYPAEAHTIQTEDGYLLEYHRIPYAKNATRSTQKYPILLHHGLLDCSIDWVINGPEKSLAYLLADRGYDVWMANARGNTYSRKHISLDSSEKKFWDFTFHEVGMYDVPAAIDYILETSKANKLIYIGHSLGTTTFYAFATGRPEYAEKILTQISMAPVGAIPRTTSIARYLIPIATELRLIDDWIYRGAFLTHDKLASWACKFICGLQWFRVNICEKLVIFNLFGKDEDQFQTSLFPMIISNLPAGTSGKNMMHCAQLVSSGGKFRHYDYGTFGNIQKYKSWLPPTYNVNEIEIPMKFFYGKNDILADPTDAGLLYQQISKPMGFTAIDDVEWNHLDFMWAKDVDTYFNDKLLDFIKNVTTNSDFITETVNRALVERDQNPMLQNIPPFNETDIMNRVAQIPGLKEMVDELSKMLKTNFGGKVN